MGAIASISDLVTRATGGSNGTPENITFWKNGRVGGAAAPASIIGRMISLWQYEGSPSHGAAPGAVSNPDNTTSGAMKQTDPGGGRTKWLLGGSAGATQLHTIVIYDRLLHISGMSGTNVGAQTVGGSLTRYVGGAGNQIWIEIYTIIGATPQTITASYTNSVPAGGHTTAAANIGNTGLREAQRLIPLTLQAGDVGVSAVGSVTLSGTTGTAGDFGVTVVHPLLMLPMGGANIVAMRDTISQVVAMPDVKTGACLAIGTVPNTITAVPDFLGSLHFVES